MNFVFWSKEKIKLVSVSSVLYLLLLLLEKANGVYAPNLLPLSVVIIVIVKDIPSTLEWKADA